MDITSSPHHRFSRRAILAGAAGVAALEIVPPIAAAQGEGASLDGVSHRTIETNGIQMHIAELGEGPLVVMLHGFPESWYSWRHQLPALAEAGFHAVAPDMRGFGQTTIPTAVEGYTQLHFVGDVIGLLDALETPPSSGGARRGRPSRSSSATNGVPPSPGTRPSCVPTAYAAWLA